MGYYYALALGEDEEVALAIKEQYMPNGEGDDLPSTKLSAIVALSIKLDTLIGLFSIGMIPTGSRDPFALRRAVNGIVRIVNEYNLEFDILKDIKTLSKDYKEFDLAVLEKFILDRIRKFYKVNPSIIEAVLVTGERELVAIAKKIKTLANVVESENFKEISSTFKRVANISDDVDITKEDIIKYVWEGESKKEYPLRQLVSELKNKLPKDYITSVVGHTGNLGQSNYAASKSGIIGMSKSLAIEYAKKNITINCVSPGFIVSDMTMNIAEKVKLYLTSRRAILPITVLAHRKHC
jgi:glycyl-tRNA synthetase beta subunit